METPSHTSNIASLVGEAFGQIGKLLQNELALAKAELANEVSKIGTNIGLLIAGALVLIPALVMVLFSIGAALIDAGFSAPVAYLIAAALGGIVAIALIAIGVARLKAMTFVPERTARQLSKDRQTISEVTR